MTTRQRLGAGLVMSTALACTFGSGMPISAQSAQARKAAPAAKRPDFNGIWQAMTPANYNILDHSAEAGVPAGQGIVEGNEIPYLPAAKARQESNFTNRLALDPENKCYMPGVPRAMYMPFPFQIAQSGDFIMMAFEWGMKVRRIHLDGSKHPEGIPETWMGDSRAHVEGQTLVIDTNDFNDQTWFDKAGNHHSDALHTIERLTPRGKDIIDYEVTIEDPKTFSRPWTMRFPLYRRLEKNIQLLEYPCVSFMEDEYAGQAGK